MKKLSELSAADRKVRVTKLVKDPNTRSKVPTRFLPEKLKQARYDRLAQTPATRRLVPDAYLSPELRAKREARASAAAPILPGSSITNADFAKQTQAAVDLEFGPDALGRQQQTAKDMAGYFDDYQRKVAEAQGATERIGRETTAGIGSLAGAFAAPDTAGLSSGNAADATNAAAVRKAILSNLGAVQTAQAGNANQYANTLANVVVPGQKLAAQAQGAASVEDLHRRIGAYKTRYQGEVKQAEGQSLAAAEADEAKTATVLAGLGMDQQRIDEMLRSNKADEKNAADANANAGRSRYGPGGYAQNKYGFSYDEWEGMTPAQQDAARKGKTGGTGKGDYLGPSGQSDAQDGIERGIAFAKRLAKTHTRAQIAQYLQGSSDGGIVYRTEKVLDSHGKDTGRTRQVKVLNGDGTPKKTGSWAAISSAEASAALDMALTGHLSKYTIDKLRSAGIKVKPLGFPTRGTSPTGAGAYPTKGGSGAGV